MPIDHAAEFRRERRRSELDRLFRELTTPELKAYALSSRQKHHTNFSEQAMMFWQTFNIHSDTLPSARWRNKTMKLYSNYVADRMQILSWFTDTIAQHMEKIRQDGLESTINPDFRTDGKILAFNREADRKIDKIELLEQLLEELAKYRSTLNTFYAEHGQDLASKIRNASWNAVAEVLVNETNWILNEPDLVWMGAEIGDEEESHSLADG